MDDQIKRHCIDLQRLAAATEYVLSTFAGLELPPENAPLRERQKLVIEESVADFYQCLRAAFPAQGEGPEWQQIRIANALANVTVPGEVSVSDLEMHRAVHVYGALHYAGMKPPLLRSIEEPDLAAILGRSREVQQRLAQLPGPPVSSDDIWPRIEQECLRAQQTGAVGTSAVVGRKTRRRGRKELVNDGVIRLAGSSEKWSETATAREFAAALDCSLGAIGDCDAWKRLQEMRKRNRADRAAIYRRPK